MFIHNAVRNLWGSFCVEECRSEWQWKQWCGQGAAPRDTPSLPCRASHKVKVSWSPAAPELYIYTRFVWLMVGQHIQRLSSESSHEGCLHHDKVPRPAAEPTLASLPSAAVPTWRLTRRHPSEKLIKYTVVSDLRVLRQLTRVAGTFLNILLSVFHKQARPRETLFARLEPRHKIAGLAGKDEGRSRELPTRHGKYQVFSASRRTRERFFLSVILLLFVFESFLSFSFIRWSNIFFPKFLKFQVCVW